MSARQTGRGRRLARPSTADEPTFSEENGVMFLHFGTPWVQGGMDLSDPARLVFDYTQQMMSWLLFLDPPRTPQRIGMLGLGAGSLARFCLKHTRSKVQVVEWNPRVTAACHSMFKLPAQGPRLNVEHDDAGEWVLRPENDSSCRVLMVDLYDAQARGPVRDSLEFYQGCRRVISGDGEAGVLVVNLFGDHDSFGANLNRITEAFQGRVATLPELDEGNRIVLAFSGPPLEVEASVLLARAEAVQARYGLPATAWAQALGARGRSAVLSF